MLTLNLSTARLVYGPRMKYAHVVFIMHVLSYYYYCSYNHVCTLPLSLQVSQLIVLVAKDVRHANGSLNWMIIGKALNRTPLGCRTKHDQIVINSSLKHGFFTEAEDAVIVQRVKEWGERRRGLWKSLEVEMNRPASYISSRYITIRSSSCASIASSALSGRLQSDARMLRGAQYHWTEENVSSGAMVLLLMLLQCGDGPLL